MNLPLLRQLRLQRQLTQQQMADRLCIGRSTYTKIEGGRSGLGVEMIHRITGVLGVPVGHLLPPSPRTEASTGFNDFDLMLEIMYESLASNKLAVLPYDELTSAQRELLAAKGFADRTAYEDTPLGGRLYTYGPRDVVRHMLGRLYMSTLFEHQLVQHATWLNYWQTYEQERAAIRAGVVQGLEPEVDETHYLTVFLIGLTMPDGTERLVQLAQRDIPDGLDEEEALARIVTATGAVEGDIWAVTPDGYEPYSEIITAV